MDERAAALRKALYDFDASTVSAHLAAAFHTDAPVRLSHPFNTLEGWEAWRDAALLPLAEAMPDLERRETIAILGSDAGGARWLGMAGYYTGAFLGPWLGIPPTGHQAALRFHEFFRLDEDHRILEMQALWDIPDLMRQASAWPMAPALGREWQVPGPATADGLGPHSSAETAGSLALVEDMIAHLGNHASGGAPAMRLDAFWHPKMSWYGPSGIGTGRGLAGFRHWHQIPFLNAMPDRAVAGDGHFFAEGAYVGFTAWPILSMTLSADGFLGLPPTGQSITMRSLDFWRVERGLIRENWVLVDLLDVYAQLGVDVLARMAEFNKARIPGRVTLPPDGTEARA